MLYKLYNTGEGVLGGELCVEVLLVVGVDLIEKWKILVEDSPQFHCLSAYASIRQHTSAYASIRQHTSAVGVHLIEKWEILVGDAPQFICLLSFT